VITEIVSAVLGASAAALVTHFVGRSLSPKEVTLTGQALVEMPDYPIKVGSNGLLRLDMPSFERVCQELLVHYNPRAAIDLLYLAEHNRNVVERSANAVLLLDKLRSRYRKKLRQLVEPQSLAAQRQHMLQQFQKITAGLGDTFAGVPIEFVLHDTRDPLHSVIVIKNSITDRKDGDQASSFGEDVIHAYATNKWAGVRHSYRLRHPKNGREVKATTISLEDRTLGLVAFLCVNIDIARLSPVSPELKDLAAKLVATPGGWGAQVFKLPVQRPPTAVP
jgi:hypothetical protein